MVAEQPPNHALLVLNAGSSSVKGAVFDAASGAPRVTLRMTIERVGGLSPALRWQDGEHTGFEAVPAGCAREHAQALAWLLQWLRNRRPSTPLAAAHRIVHGADRYTRPVRVDAAVLHALTALEALAPLHQAAGLAGIRAVDHAWPGLPQVACFDTAFHSTQPALARTCALPLRYRERGLRRYGFHGLSCESALRQLGARNPALARRRLIVAHLGSGTSLTAIAEGRSVASTMGFSTLDGPPMSTRSGSLDPGILLHLLREGMTVDELEHLLYHDAGLRALAGGDGDMRELLAREATDEAAAFAIMSYVYHVQRAVGALTAALGGLDALVFTGGIGEHSAPLRARVLQGLAWLGLELDPAANDLGANLITRPTAAVAACVVATDEEFVMADAAWRLLRDASAL